MSNDRIVNKLAMAIGKGLLAGLAGTAAITISQMMQQQITGSGASEAPSRVGGKVLGVQPRNPEGKARFSQVMHWSYGTSWGLMRGAMELAGLRGLPASAIHWIAIWAAELAMVPNMTDAPQATEMEPQNLAIDGGHHAVYAFAAGAVYDLMSAKEEEHHLLRELKEKAKETFRK
ncbi:MAG: hypothetical protein WD077_08095 [Bacteroidia bacterium]